LFAALRRSMSLDDTAAFLQVSNVPGPTVLRVNVKRVSRPELRQRLWHEGIHTDEGVLSPWSLVVRGHANLWGSSAFRAGLFEVQDEGSQRIARHAAPQADDVVVDLCAGHGGKTLAMMAAFSLARMHVHDVNQQALVALVGRAQRLGQKVHVGLPDAPCDVVLVDAPCSSTGVLRRHADLRHQYNDDDLQRLLNVQRALLAQASGLLRTGGRLVYATCSVLREENDDQVAFVARHLPQLHLQHCERTLPHVHGCDGFFVAVFVRR
jgi:16S rRNA (cytosine967-C5)-methyltransferase